MSYQSTCEDLLCYAAGPTLGSNGGILDTSLVCEARQLGGNVALWQATKKRLCGEPWPTFSFMKKGRNVHGAEPGEPAVPDSGSRSSEAGGGEQRGTSCSRAGRPGSYFPMCVSVCMAGSRITEDSRTRGSSSLVFSSNAGEQ